MRELVWLESAMNDVIRLRKFIARENPSVAASAAKSIKDATKYLIRNPEIGKPVTALPPYRDLLARFGAAGYVIRYRVHLDIVYIVHVRHYRESDF